MDALKTFWGKIAIIGFIGSVGFTMGCYYQETKMIREITKEDREKFQEWYDKENEYKEIIDAMRNERIELNKKISLLEIEIKKTSYEER